MRKVWIFLLLTLVASCCTTQLTWGSTQSDWRAGMLRYFDSITFETLDVMAPVKLFDDFWRGATANVFITGGTPNGEFLFAAVNSGTAEIQAATRGGILTMTTGAADNDDNDLATPVVWYPGKWCAMEARLAGSDVSLMAMNVGFSDAQGEAADKLACTYNGSTLTSNASDCALFFWDSAGTTDYIRCVAVDTDVDGTVTSSAVAEADNTYHIYRVEIDESGNCDFWLDGTHVYQETTGVTPHVPLCVYIGVINRSAAAQVLYVDYVRVWQSR